MTKRIAYDDEYEGLALDAEEGDRLAHKMGNRSLLMMASHGVLAVGPSVAECFNDLYYLERAARFQVLARATGGKLRTISQDVRDRVRQNMGAERVKVADRHFTAPAADAGPGRARIPKLAKTRMCSRNQPKERRFVPAGGGGLAGCR